MLIKLSLFSLLSLSLLSGLQCSSESTTAPNGVSFALSHKFDRDKLSQALRKIAEKPHPIGSDQQLLIRDFIVSEGKSIGLDVSVDTFTARVPNPIFMTQADAPASLTLEKKGYNIYGVLAGEGNCTYLVGSHYDTKQYDSFYYLGANDSASSSAALFELARALKEYPQTLPCALMFVWFDGEEAYLNNWNDGLTRHPAKIQDNTYGSRHLANQLVTCSDPQKWCLPSSMGSSEVKGILLLDMIGSENVVLTRDNHSTKSWLDLAVELDDTSDLHVYGQYGSFVEDDHIPFLRKGIDGLNMIDFNNLQYWHKQGDDPDKISYDSVEKVMRLALSFLIEIQNDKPN